MAWHVGGCRNTKTKPSWLKMNLQSQSDLAARGHVTQVALWSAVNALTRRQIVSSYLNGNNCSTLYLRKSNETISVNATAMT
jgi:hypothetical protein